MVICQHIPTARLVRDQRGVTLVEALITFPVVLLTLTVMVEFGVAVHQWNQTVKAMQLGARLAAVSAPLADLQPILDHYETGTIGQPPPSGAPVVSCGAGGPACNAAELNRLVFGSDGTCDPDFGGTRPGICDFYRGIGPDQIRITYYPSGLGYVGRTGLPVVSITLETVGVTFEPFFLGALLGVGTIEMPPHPVTVTSEDLSNGPVN